MEARRRTRKFVDEPLERLTGSWRATDKVVIGVPKVVGSITSVSSCATIFPSTYMAAPTFETLTVMCFQTLKGSWVGVVQDLLGACRRLETHANAIDRVIERECEIRCSVRCSEVKQTVLCCVGG